MPITPNFDGEVVIEDGTGDRAFRRESSKARLSVAVSRLCASSLLLLAVAVAGDARAQLRGLRYCEVLALHMRGGALEVDVWNSLAAGDPCLPAAWDALDPVAIQQELGAVAIVLNGLRFWVLDFITSANLPGPLHTFGDIDMRLAATVSVPSGGIAMPYSGNSVNRDTQFLFRAGQEVYELIDPDGRNHIMQSYSQAVDDTLTEADLAQLGGRLALPDGWTFRVRVLDFDHVVEDQSGVATVIQDELENSYQYFGFLEHPPGRGLRVRGTQSGPKRLFLVARDAAIQAHAPCEVDGELVVESRGAGAPPRRFPLEPGRWRPINRNQPQRGCRYDHGPVVRHLRLRAGKLRVSAMADDLGVPLDVDPTPVRIRLRHGERNDCFTFGGEVTHRSGRHVTARNAPAVETCPSTPLAP